MGLGPWHNRIAADGNWEDDDPTLGINFEAYLDFGKGLVSTDSKAQPGMDYRYREETWAGERTRSSFTVVADVGVPPA